MDRLQEIEYKHGLVRQLLTMYQSPALHLRRTRNIAWFTGGVDATINSAAEMGSYSLLVTPDARHVITDNIEITRIRGEEPYEALGFRFEVNDWVRGRALPADIDASQVLVDDAEIETALQGFRMRLTAPEQDRLRTLGRDAGAALEEAARAIQPGDTEFEIAARLDAACRRRGGFAMVNLIAVDDRISSYRHPTITKARIERYGMVIVCMRREGLIAAATRLVHFGPVPDELQAKLLKVAHIEAATMVASTPGRTLGEVFDDLRQAYADQGEADQWRNHHQGGPLAYLPREMFAVPDHPYVLQSGNALAYNPSIVGCKSEDTILLTDNGFEIVTTTGEWPMVTVSVSGQQVSRPAILEL